MIPPIKLDCPYPIALQSLRLSSEFVPFGVVLYQDAEDSIVNDPSPSASLFGRAWYLWQVVDGMDIELTRQESLCAEGSIEQSGP